MTISSPASTSCRRCARSPRRRAEGWEHSLPMSGLSALEVAHAGGGIHGRGGDRRRRWFWEMTSWASRHSRDEDERPIRYVSTSDHRSLFDGLSLREWLPPATGGTWELGTDEESEPILTGMGFTRRTFAPPECYRLTLGVDVHEAATTEVHFGIPSAAPNAGERFVVQISRSGGAAVGSPRGGSWPVSSAWRKCPLPFGGLAQGSQAVSGGPDRTNGPNVDRLVQRSGPGERPG